jgi:hypothetical protein
MWTFSVVGWRSSVIQRRAWRSRPKPPVPPIGSISKVIPSGAKAFLHNSRLRA